MLDQSTFTETVREVAEIIRTSATPLSKEEILRYFKDMELNEQQENMVLEFLLTPHEEEETEEEESDREETDWEETSSEEEFSDAAEVEQSDKKEGNEKEESNLPDSKVFRMYVEELESLPVYSESRLEEMYEKLLAGDEAVIVPLSEGWMRQVLEIAKNLAVTSEGFEDVVQEGNMALFLRLTELCGAGEGAVAENLTEAVEAAMKASIVELEGEDEEEKAVVGKVALVNEAKKYLATEQGREATVKELSDYTSLPEEELTDLLLLIEKAGAKEEKN